jgi:hypothetical protein
MCRSCIHFDKDGKATRSQDMAMQDAGKRGILGKSTALVALSQEPGHRLDLNEVEDGLITNNIVYNNNVAYNVAKTWPPSKTDSTAHA